MEFIKNYEIPISLWNMINENVPPNEIYEVKSFLGDDLVDQSIELRSEITVLMEIYKTYSDEQAAGDSSKHFLPEPPDVRERLLKEIQFFVNGIREQARSQGRNPDKVLENRPSDIIDYAYESSSSRPTTSNDSLLSTSRSSYRVTPLSDRINVSLFKEKLNYIEFEEVQSNLKQFLQDEVDQLNADLIEIHKTLYNDDSDRSMSRMTQHTISELKHERHELEQILLQSSRPLSNNNAKVTNSKISHYPTKNSKKSLFKLVPDSDTSHNMPRSSSVKSPTKLKPIEIKDTNKSSYVESPLDLGLPETTTMPYDDFTNTNNSYMDNNDNETTSQSDRSDSSQSQFSKSGKFNSAQRFRQRILQNRKETLNY